MYYGHLLNTTSVGTYGQMKHVQKEFQEHYYSDTNISQTQLSL